MKTKHVKYHPIVPTGTGEVISAAAIARSGGLLFILFALMALPRARGADSALELKPPPEAVKLAGTYTGSWTMFGINRAGEPVRRMRWTDVMKADAPKCENGRAFVTTIDEMTFEGQEGHPMRIPGKEGYELRSDGSLGDYFIETGGQRFKLVRLAQDTWAYEVPASPQELTRMGFPPGASGRHVVVKATGTEARVEVHRISRLTTVTWKAADGQERTIQFISLQGTHRRTGDGGQRTENREPAEAGTTNQSHPTPDTRRQRTDS